MILINLRRFSFFSLISAASLAMSSFSSAQEPNDSIPTATPSGILAGEAKAVTLMGNNGDGDHASSGDIDFYKLSANSGQIIRIDVEARSIGRVMDSVVGLYNSDGELVATNDDDGQSQDSFINIAAPADDDYFIAVSSWVAGDGPANMPTDPFTPGNGPGAPAGGIDDYDLIVGLDVPVIITRSGGAFPVVATTETSTTTLTLQNDGQEMLEVSDLSFTGDNAAQFSIVTPLPLDPVPSGGTVAIEISFSPSGLNGRVSATLVIESNDTIVPVREVTLTGAAYRPGGLIARFPFDEPVGTSIGTFGDVADITGNEFSARYFTNGGASITFARPALFEGDGGTSVQFTGNPNSYIQVSNLVHLPSVSISLWFKPEGPGALFNRDPMFTANDTFYGLDISGEDALRWRVGGETIVETEPGAIQAGEVYHAVVTHLDEDGFGNDTATRSRLFLNGVLIGEVDSPIGYDSYDNVEGTNNRRLWIATKSGGQGYGGEIDDFQVYDVELSPEEALSLFNNPGTAARVEDPNLAVIASNVFGTLPPKAGTQDRQLAITNTGESKPLNISASNLTGPDQDHFTVSTVPTVIAPGMTEFIAISFDPAGGDGTFVAQLEFVSDDEGSDSIIVDLSTRIEKESGLLTHFSMDETEGTVMTDVSGNGFHGTYQAVDGGTFTLGEPGLAGGTAVRLNDAGGTGSAFGEIAKEVGLPELSSLTISMWIKIDPAEINGTAVLFSKGEVVGDPFSAVLGVTDGLNPFQWFAAGDEAVATSPALSVDTVHHVVVSHSDVNGADEGAELTKIYVDNVIVAESANSIGFDDQRPSVLQIGAFIGSLGLNGTVDDFQLYSQAYGDDDVAFLFNNPGKAIGQDDGPPVGGADSDEDGLPDDFEIANFGDLTQDGSGDFDNDGQSNAIEFAAGTLAADSTSRFDILSVTREGDQVSVTFPFVEGRVYELQGSADMTNFAPVADAVLEQGTFTWPNSGAQQFLRVGVSVE